MFVKILHSLNSIEPDAWDALLPKGFPFTKHAFLLSLEQSGCIGRNSGWDPHYLTVHDEDHLVAALLLYKKNHSYGEFIFDWAWARAFEKYGRIYYPKLTSAIPMTPVTAPKLLLHPKAERTRILPLIQKSLTEIPEQTATHSLHFLYLPQTELEYYAQLPFMLRKGIQFIWNNRDYRSFEDFLAQLRRKRRVVIQRERNQMRKSGLAFATLVGQEIQEEHMARMYEFYLSTHDKRGGMTYLNREFFLSLREQMPEHLLLTTAWTQKKMVAAALHFLGDHSLYGRYWGCEQEYRGLHFELSYYSAIDYAIAHRLQRVEAGAQGEHKFLRGYEPEVIYSLHWIKDPIFQEPIRRYIEAENREVDAMLRYFDEHSAYKLK